MNELRPPTPDQLTVTELIQQAHKELVAFPVSYRFYDVLVLSRYTCIAVEFPEDSQMFSGAFPPYFRVLSGRFLSPSWNE